MSTDTKPAETTVDLDEPTPGPWGWFGNTQGHDLYLATVNHGRRSVMHFKRWGTRRAQPEFQVKRGDYGVMVPASELVKFEVGDGGATGHAEGKADRTVYRMDVEAIDHPDARLIMTSPELLRACKLARATLAANKPWTAETHLAIAHIDAALSAVYPERTTA